MSKQKNNPSKAADELVIMLDQSFSAPGDSHVASTNDANSLISKYNLELTPLFDAVSQSAPFYVAEASQEQGLSSFYSVSTSEDKESLAKSLLKEPQVIAAYVKPAPEPPVYPETAASETDELPDSVPATPSFIDRQIYLNAAPAGIDALYAHTLPGGKGEGVRVIDIEGAWRFTHEDLRINQGGVIGGTQSTDLGWRNHGTAVVGEIGGDENTVGIVGIAPNANVRAVSIFGGLGSAGAIKKAADSLNAGDIILIELHRAGPRHNYQGRDDQAGYIAIEWWPDDFAAIRYAISKGVIVVEAAGNGAENLSDSLYNTRPSGFPATWKNPFNTANPSSGAVVVGAGAPPPGTHGRNHGTDRSRLDFSNYGARVDTQGWGREVTTCGYGNLQGGSNEDLWYTDTFSGTSSASPIVVGALACIQGRLKNRNKTLLTPNSAINLLRTTGSVQQSTAGRPASQRIGNRPNLKEAFTKLNIAKSLVKDTIKDTIKDITKDSKEIRKELIQDNKHLIKELRKEVVKEVVKEVKEFEILDDWRERIRTDIQNGPAEAPSADQRLEQLEETVALLQHFIGVDLRPDLLDNLVNPDNYQPEST